MIIRRLGEVLPALGSEGVGGAVGCSEFYGAGFGDGADAGDGDADDLAGDVVPGRRSEEQFVIFSAVKGVAEAVAAGGDWEEGLIDEGADFAFVADVAEVGGEAVAGVDHGGGEFLLAQILADGDARVGVEVARMFRRLQLLAATEFCECGDGEAEGSGHVEDVAGAGSGAEDGFAFGDAAEDDDVGEDTVGRLGGIAAGKGDGVLLRQLQEAGDEAVNPALGKVGGNGKREESCVGRASHGGDVAESAGEAAVADGIGRMPFAAEVDSFEGEVGGDEGLRAAGKIEYGAVVSDAESEFVTSVAGGAADTIDQVTLFEGHGLTNIYSHRSRGVQKSDEGQFTAAKGSFDFGSTKGATSAQG